MKNKIFKFIILPIIISLIAYIAIAIISVDFISLKSVHGYSIEKETLHNIRVMKYYFITLPLMSIIPSVIYYAIIFLRKIMDRMNIQSNKDDHISNDISIIKSEINNIHKFIDNIDLYIKLVKTSCAGEQKRIDPTLDCIGNLLDSFTKNRSNIAKT